MVTLTGDGGQTLTKNLPMSNDTWNQIKVDISGWAPRSKVSRLAGVMGLADDVAAQEATGPARAIEFADQRARELRAAGYRTREEQIRSLRSSWTRLGIRIEDG